MSNTGRGPEGYVYTGRGRDIPPSFQELGTNSGLTLNGVLIGGGDTPITAVTPGTIGQVFTAQSNGPPIWTTLTASIPQIGASTDNGIVTWNGTTGSAVRSTAATVSSAGTIAAQVTSTSATAPAYSFLGDTNTGMYSDAADTLRFTTGGTNRITINTGTVTTFIGVTVSSGNLTFSQGLVGNVRAVAGSITGSTSDFCLIVTDTSSARTVTVPNAANSNQIFVIKDGSGAAGLTPITITTPGGTKTFDGQTSIHLKANWASVMLIYDGTNYLVL